MPAKIRLRRMGATKRPMYRVVVADSESPRDGGFIESIGHYNPLTDPATISIDADKAKEWLSKGATPTLVVAKLLKRVGMEEDIPKKVRAYMNTQLSRGGSAPAETAEKQAE